MTSSARVDSGARQQGWRQRLERARARVSRASGLTVEGHLTRVAGITLEALGCRAPVGSYCYIENAQGEDLEAEVVGFAGDKLFLTPVGDLHGVLPNARVTPTGRVTHVSAGDNLLGRVLDGRGQPLDGAGPVHGTTHVPLNPPRRNPLARHPIHEPLDVGVRAINALLSVGRGQRLGLFAGSGVGKSVLLGMMTRYTEADIVVVALIGERGREVQEFIQTSLGPEGLARSVVVAAPADSPPLMRLRGAALATSIAEYFRDCGLQVLLLMDSLTRFAQAQREIGLAIGEPPATKGYPPSVFAKLPELVERAGTDVAGGGSITAFYTVLTEGDPETDPIADSARAILDGHIVLSRAMAEAGTYPAIDVEASISRAMLQVVDPGHDRAARRFKQVYSVYQQHRDLISVGAYSRGSSPEVDAAIDYHPRCIAFIQQDLQQKVNLADSVNELHALMGESSEAGPTQAPQGMGMQP